MLGCHGRLPGGGEHRLGQRLGCLGLWGGGVQTCGERTSLLGNASWIGCSRAEMMFSPHQHPPCPIAPHCPLLPPTPSTRMSHRGHIPSTTSPIRLAKSPQSDPPSSPLHVASYGSLNRSARITLGWLQYRLANFSHEAKMSSSVSASQPPSPRHHKGSLCSGWVRVCTSSATNTPATCSLFTTSSSMSSDSQPSYAPPQMKPPSICHDGAATIAALSGRRTALKSCSTRKLMYSSTVCFHNS